MLEEYNKRKNKLEEIYGNITEGVKVRTKISWSEEGEKSSKFLINLEKTKPVQGIIKELEIENKDISDPNKISNEINRFLKNLSINTLQTSLPQVNNFIENMILPVLTQEQKQDWKKGISEKEVLDALKSFSYNKPPGNEGSTKEFHETCWSELEELFMNYSSQIKISKKLITSCRQTVLKLIEEKDEDKRFIINWRPVLLLNMDYKIISKVFSDRLEKILSLLISSQQTRCISESGRLISNLLDVTKVFNTKSYSVTIDMDKVFDSLNHSLLLTTLEKFGFGTNFIDWIKYFFK